MYLCRIRELAVIDCSKLMMIMIVVIITYTNTRIST